MRILQRWRTSCACHANGCRALLSKSQASTLDFVQHTSLSALLPARLFSPFPHFPPHPDRGNTRPVHASITCACSPSMGGKAMMFAFSQFESRAPRASVSYTWGFLPS